MAVISSVETVPSRASITARRSFSTSASRSSPPLSARMVPSISPSSLTSLRSCSGTSCLALSRSALTAVMGSTLQRTASWECARGCIFGLFLGVKNCVCHPLAHISQRIFRALHPEKEPLCTARAGNTPTVRTDNTPGVPRTAATGPARIYMPMASEAREPPSADELDIHATAGKLADLQRRRYEAVHAGSARAVEKQHAKGKTTARERIDALLDPGSFVEFDALARHRSTAFGLENNRPYGDGVVTGHGTVDGRPVAVFSQDVTVFGGSLGEVYVEKIVKVLDHALQNGCPVVGINEGGGARVQEGVVALGLYAEIFKRNTHASGVVPQISLIMGATAGGHVYSPALTDFTVMVDQTSQMFITGPDVIKTVTGEDISMEELGGAATHSRTSGVAHYMGTDEQDAIDYVKDLLSHLPDNNLEETPLL